MFSIWFILASALAYVGFLFLVAHIGDVYARRQRTVRGNPLVYSLSLAVYCTSWTFFGSVGLAAVAGFEFIPVYLGASLMIGLGWPLIQRIARLAKTENITSIADFIAARYGKSQFVASVVTLIAVVGALPYLALQLKAVSTAVTVMIQVPGGLDGGEGAAILPAFDIAFVVAMTMAVFAVLFGTRHADATEHQDGMMLAVATESLVKLLAFLVVGGFVTFWMFDGLGDLLARAAESERATAIFERGLDGGKWLTVTFLSLVCVILLPRQFHVAIVENHNEREVRWSAWIFPLYLVLINLFVVPIAIAGVIMFPQGGVDSDMFVLGLPLVADAPTITMIAFIGGLSAATAMVIVASIALAIMLCNDVVVPMILRRRFALTTSRREFDAMGPMLLNIRRVAIFAILLLAYAFHRTLGQDQALASIGLLSFVAVAQFAPAFFGGLFWRRGTARGALVGMTSGFAVWIFTMVLPWSMQAGLVDIHTFENGLFGIGLFKPTAFFSLEFGPLPHAVFWSMLVNVAAYVGVSLFRQPEPIERVQANIFVQGGLAISATPGLRLWRTSIPVADLVTTAGTYLGAERAERSFTEYTRLRGTELDRTAEADVQLLRFTEHLLASAIGSASSRLVLSLLLKQRNVGHRSALRLLDDASEALQYNRDLLQSALDQVAQGISVFDKDHRLICWNRRYRELLELPPELGRIGVPLGEILKYQAARGDFGPGDVDHAVARRMQLMAFDMERFQEQMQGGRRVLEIHTSPMPQGGFVATHTDISERVRAAEVLARANETLERRVNERTAELTHVNYALAGAKRKADAANQEKTRFIAAASHDILQPLNAARLYTTSLRERPLEAGDERLAHNIDASLEAVEEILGALLDISRLDAGAMKAEFAPVPVAELFQQIELEFEPVARNAGLRLHFVPTRVWVQSDRRLLRRVLQNLVSNALKYTSQGDVVVGCRRAGSKITIGVYDTGPGIAVGDQENVFVEFHRLENAKSSVRGLGLGLSIVQRICKVLEHPLELRSVPGRGSVFSISAPRAQAVPAPVHAAQSMAGGQSLDGVPVLCIDNEQAILDGMSTLLSGWGCEVATLSSVAEAIAHAKTDASVPAVIFADYHLDDGTGLDAIEVLQRAWGVDVPASIITADLSQAVANDVRARGHALLRKPVKPAALRALLMQVRRIAAAAE